MGAQHVVALTGPAPGPHTAPAGFVKHVKERLGDPGLAPVQHVPPTSAKGGAGHSVGCVGGVRTQLPFSSGLLPSGHEQ